MFNWRKKDADFEWHRYVRTTIKLRRDDRRRRIDEAKGAAADGLRLAGVHSAAAGRSFGTLLWNWIANFVTGVFHLCNALLKRGWHGLVTISGSTWVAARREAGRLALFIWRLPPVQALIGVGIAAAGSAYIWKLNFGASQTTVLAEGIGLASILIAGLIWIWPEASRLLARWARLPGLPTLRGPSALPKPSLPVATALVAAGLLAVAGWFSWSNDWRFPSPQLPSLALFSGGEIRGRALAVTGDTLRLAGKLIKLESIEAPELRQTCNLTSRRPWSCGRQAQAALAKLLRRRSVTCVMSSTAANGASTARCRTTDGDIGEALVSSGHVFASQGFFAAYASAEAGARSKRRGIWRGSAVRPSEYRSQQWEAAKADAPGGCPIKGQLKRGKRFYVPPWSADYGRITVRERRGDRWFCSEAEALAAGWHPIENS